MGKTYLNDLIKRQYESLYMTTLMKAADDTVVTFAKLLGSDEMLTKKRKREMVRLFRDTMDERLAELERELK